MTPFAILGEMRKEAARGDQTLKLIQAITSRAKVDRFGEAGEALAGGVNELSKVNIGHLPPWYRFNRDLSGSDNMTSNKFKGFAPQESGKMLTHAIPSAARESGESGVLAKLVKAWRSGAAAPGLENAHPHAAATGRGLLQGIDPRAKV